MQLLSGSTPVTAYTPGGSYTIKVTGTNTGTTSLPRFGYQLTATKTTSATTNAGTLTAPVGSHTVTVGGVRIAEQSAALAATTGTGGSGTTYVVSIPWTAPVAGTGGITFRTVVNAINQNGNADAGDKWNSGSLAITEASTAAIASAATQAFSVYPNPCSGTFAITVPGLATETAHVAITSVSGQLLKEMNVDIHTAQNVATGLPPGIYLLQVATPTAAYRTQLIVQ